MTNSCERLPGDVRALLTAAVLPLRYQLAAARGDVATLVVAPGVEWPVLPEPHTTRAGVRCAVVPRALVDGVALVPISQRPLWRTVA